MAPEEREQFARDNYNLIFSFMNTYHIRFREDEIIDILFLGYTYALNNYDKAKGTFATLAYTCMKREYFKYLKCSKYQKRDKAMFKLVPLDKLVDPDDETYFGDLIADPQINVEKEVLDGIYWKDSFDNIKEVANKTFTKRELQVFNSIYVENHNIKETSKILGISNQAVTALNKIVQRRLLYWFRRYKNKDRTISRREENYGEKDV